jgi:hypothetical protein
MTTTESAGRHVHRARGEGRRLRVLSDIVEIKLTGAETNGAHAVYCLRVAERRVPARSARKGSQYAGRAQGPSPGGIARNSTEEDR